MCLPFLHKWSAWQWRLSYRTLYNALAHSFYRDSGVLGERICKRCLKHKTKFISTPYPQQLIEVLKNASEYDKGVDDGQSS